MTRSELQLLSRTRLREARLLFASGQFSGAYYLSGYVVECALKACIARSTARYEFPDKDRVQRSYSHKPAELIKVAGLVDELQAAIQLDGGLRASWTIVVNWSEQSRYAIWNRGDADAMMTAVASRKAGVFPWITQHW